MCFHDGDGFRGGLGAPKPGKEKPSRKVAEPLPSRTARPGSYPERARVRAREVHIWEATAVVKLPEESESESKRDTHLGSHVGGEAT